jgi:hypothetical protein
MSLTNFSMGGFSHSSRTQDIVPNKKLTDEDRHQIELLPTAAQFSSQGNGLWEEVELIPVVTDRRQQSILASLFPDQFDEPQPLAPPPSPPSPLTASPILPPPPLPPVQHMPSLSGPPRQQSPPPPQPVLQVQRMQTANELPLRRHTQAAVTATAVAETLKRKRTPHHEQGTQRTVVHSAPQHKQQRVIEQNSQPVQQQQQQQEQTFEELLESAAVFSHCFRCNSAMQMSELGYTQASNGRLHVNGRCIGCDKHLSRFAPPEFTLAFKKSKL